MIITEHALHAGACMGYYHAGGCIMADRGFNVADCVGSVGAISSVL